MKVTEVTVGVKRLIALAKYENVTYSVELTASVEEGEDADKVYTELKDSCKAKILAEMERLSK